MMKMITNTSEIKLFDCIWIVQPPNTYLHLKSHLSLRVDTFNAFGQNSKLIIRGGTTSDKSPLERYTALSKPTMNSLVTPIISGFYISFRGYFTHESHLALVYTAFSYISRFIQIIEYINSNYIHNHFS